MKEIEEESNFFSYKSHRLHYRILGRGVQAMLLFHGYGQDHSVFQQITSSLGDRFKLYCFDLFYHGKSSHPPLDNLITTEDWSDVIQCFLDTYQIDRVSLLGYSMGGRFALSLVGNLSERIDELILIAPDGIQSRGWYQVSSTTWLGRTLLRRTVVRPELLFTLTGIARKYGLAHKSMLKFAEKHMRTSRNRYQVYRCWVGLRRIQPRLPFVIRHCNRQAIPVKIYLGKYDRVVKAKPIWSFHNELASSHLHQLPCGHNALISAVGADLSTKS